MTPLKTKRPLPSLPLTSARCPPKHPASFSEWQIALQGVKLLYLKLEYKQCASRCTQLLEEAKPLLHPAHRTFLLFYCALSYEMTARSQHNLSITKLSLLELAQEYYHFAACYLPTPEQAENRSVRQDYSSDDEDAHEAGSSCSDEAEDAPQDSYSQASSTPSSPTTTISPHDPIFMRSSSPSSIESCPVHTDDTATDDWSSYRSSILRPSPLRIRKAVRFSPARYNSSLFAASPTPQPHAKDASSTSNAVTPTEPNSPSIAPSPSSRPRRPTASTAPSSPASFLSMGSKTPDPSSPLLPHSATAISLSKRLSASPSLSSHASIVFSDSTSAWLRQRSLQRYNNHLIALGPMIEKHISTVSLLISKTVDAQSAQKKPVPVNSNEYGERDVACKEKAGECKAGRIKNMTERACKRKRFDNARYERLCESALAEL